MFAPSSAAPASVNPSRRSFTLLSIPFAAVTLATLVLYFLSDQTLEALRKSMQFSDVWMEADRGALLQLDRCIDLGGQECDLVAKHLKRPLAYVRATRERVKPQPDTNVIEQSLKEAGLDASPFRFRLHWLEHVSQVAGLPLRNVEDQSVQNARLRGEMPADLQTIFDFTQRARGAWAHAPPDTATLAALKDRVAFFRASLETAKARFDANSFAASQRLRHMLYLLVAGCVLAMFGIATWLFRRMLRSWQELETSFHDRDRRLTHELSLHVRQLQTALADKNVLLQEVQHRVKNNLAIISSLLTLEAGQSGCADAEPVLIRTRDRIHSMALVHERLCHDGPAADIDFAEYVEFLSRDLLTSFGVESHRIQLHICVQVRLGLVEAIPCGLIINELLTNSLKHAFPNGQIGNIWLSLTQLHKGQADLYFRDDGIGLPPGFDLTTPHSLGMQIVSDLTTQLAGTLEREPGAGTRFHLHFQLQPEQNEKLAMPA